MERSIQERLSRALTRVLRHKALDYGLKMTPDGYVKLGDLLKISVFDQFTEDDKKIEKIQEIVRNCKKQRFRLRHFDPNYKIPQLQTVLEESKLGSNSEYRKILEDSLKVTMQKLMDSSPEDKLWQDMRKAGMKPGHVQKLMRYVGDFADDMRKKYV
eukprot:jgi/Bigna1/143663/aug1.80_g18371